MTKLPSEGRTGPAPVWPLLPPVSLTAELEVAEAHAGRLQDEWGAADPKEAKNIARRLDTAERKVAELRALVEQVKAQEQTLWVELWATPQAVMWDKLKWSREVAQYVRWKVRAESGDLDASKEARQLADRLGLNPLSMLRLRWAIAEDEVAEKRTTRPRSSRRPGLRAVSGE